MALESCPRDLHGEYLALTPGFFQGDVELDVWVSDVWRVGCVESWMCGRWMCGC